MNAEKGEGPTVAKKFSVSGFPTIVFVDPSGSVIDTIVGYEPAADFAKDLKRISQEAHDLAPLKARVQANPGDTASASKLAGILVHSGQLTEAQTLLARAEKANPAGKSQLAACYLALGKAYVDQQQSAKAMSWLQTAINTSKDPAVVSDARIKLAEAYYESGKIPQSKAELQKIIDSPNSPASAKQAAQQILKNLQEQK